MVLMFLFCGCFVGLSFIQNYMLFAIELISWARLNNKHWSYVMYFMSFVVFLNFLLIIWNMRVNHKFRNFFDKGPTESPLILYLVCLPLLTLALIGMVFIVICDFSAVKHSGLSNGLFALTVVFVFFAFLVLFIKTNGARATDENWGLNYINAFTIAVSIITLLNLLFYNVVIKIGFSFILATKHLHNDTKSSNIKPPLQDTFNYLIKYIQTTLISLNICLTPFLMISLHYYLKVLQRRVEAAELHFESRTLDRSHFSGDLFKVLLSSFGFCLGIILSLTKIIPGFFSPNKLTIIIDCIKLALMLMFTFYMICKVKKWPRISRNSFLLHFYFVLGIVGELTVITLNFYYGITQNWVRNGRSICILVEVLFQAVLTWILLPRQKSCRPEKIEIISLLYIAVINGLNVMNQLFCPDNYYYMPADNYSTIQNIVLSGMKKIAEPFSFLYKICIILIMANAIIN